MKTHYSIKMHSSIEPLESRIAPAVLIVTNLTDSPVSGKLDLRQAITHADAASGATTIMFSPLIAPGTLYLGSDLPVISKNVTITGPLLAGVPEIKISGADFASPTNGSLLDVSSTSAKGVGVTISNLTIEGANGGSQGGALFINDAHGTVTLSHDMFQNNSVGGSTVTSQARGGAVYLEAGTLNITVSTFENNSAIGGNSTTSGGGNASGGAIFIGNHGKVTMTNSIVSNNSATGGNGGNGQGGTISQTNGYQGYSGGTAYGGGITNNGRLTMANTTVSGNTATGGAGGTGGSSYNGASNPGNGGYGGGAQGGGIYSTGTLTLVGSTVSGNTATGGAGGTGAAGSGNGGYGGQGGSGGSAAGGGIWSSGTLNIPTAKGMLSSKITGNSAVGGTGGTGGTGANGYNGSYQTNSGGNGGQGGYGGNATGGGIEAYYGGNVSIAKTTVSGNTTTAGTGGTGGSGGSGGTNSVGNSPFNYLGGPGGNGGTGGQAGGSQGAGVYFIHSKVSVNASTISGNTALAGLAGTGGQAGSGGGVSYAGNYYGYYGAIGSAGSGGSVIFSYGGGVFASETKLSLVQATIANNTADYGGGIALHSNVNTQIDNTTIAGNTANENGGGIWGDTSPINAISTVIGQNSAPTDSDIHGSIFATNSLIYQLGDALVFDGGGSLFNIYPDLKPLASNGGLTQTMLPYSDSPLIGAGSNPLHLMVDQRGDPRAPDGLVDIGAVELT